MLRVIWFLAIYVCDSQCKWVLGMLHSKWTNCQELLFWRVQLQARCCRPIDVDFFLPDRTVERMTMQLERMTNGLMFCTTYTHMRRILGWLPWETSIPNYRNIKKGLLRKTNENPPPIGITAEPQAPKDRKEKREMCSITLILYMSTSVDPTSWCTYSKTVIVFHRIFNYTHELNVSNPLTSPLKKCVLVPHQLYICISNTSRNERSKRCPKTLTKWQKKDAHPDLTDLFPVTPALANDAISTSVTQKLILFSSP